MALQKFTILIISVVAVFLILVIVGLGRLGTKTSPSPKTQIPKPEVKKTSYEEAAAFFPASFPFESGAKVVNIYQYLPPASAESQATIEYESKKTLAENRKIFTDYLAKNNFKITNQDEEPNQLFYYALTSGRDLSIKVETKEGKVIVTASIRKTSP